LIKLGVYDQIVKQLEDKYLNDYKEIITEYFIDSTLLNNHNGTSVMAGFCYITSIIENRTFVE